MDGGRKGGGGGGGGDGGDGGGGVHSAESPANSRLRPVGVRPLLLSKPTTNVAFTYPKEGRKKICTPRLAATSLRLVGSLGLSAGLPDAVDVNVPVARSTCSVEPTTLPELGRSGVL